MNRLGFVNREALYVEIGQTTLHALQGEQGLELPVERLPNGRLSLSCKQNLTRGLQAFVKRKPWRPQTKAFCAIAARGVSLRRIALPNTSNENLQRLLLLQIESEFPLSPDELAWGYMPLKQSKATGNGSPGQQDFLVAAVKKELTEEYSEILSACGISAVFTVAALARQALCPSPTRPQALLDIGRHHSELTVFENGIPKAIRIIAWGGETITQALEAGLGVTRTEAEDLKIKRAQGELSPGDIEEKIQAAFETGLDAFMSAANNQQFGEKLYVTGPSVHLKDLVPGLGRRLAPATICEAIEPPAGAGRTSAITGLRAAAQRGDGNATLIIKGKLANESAGAVRPPPWKWVALTACLLMFLLAVPYLEAIALKPYLTRKLAALKSDRHKLALIDAEWSLFQHLKQNAPPYLDALFLLAKAAPPGARIDSLSMNRRGDLSMKCSMQNPQQVADFRSKLIDSGFFEHLTVEEQVPSPDRQKLAVRISAQWKPPSARQTLAFGPTAEEIEKAKNRPREPQMGAPMMMPPMMGGMPGPMPQPSDTPPLRTRPPRTNPTGPMPPAPAPTPPPPGSTP